MAILNVTPDSFSDGGRFQTPTDVVEAATRAIDDGADLLDIGGESTRPGAARVDADEQIARTVPAIRAIRDAGIALPITIDTTRAQVAEAALDAGADAINDVSGGTEDAAMLGLAADRKVGVVLMHRLTTPDLDRYSDTYDRPPDYRDVVAEVAAALESLASRAIEAGVPNDAIVLDPGLGFGKSVEQNLSLIRGTRDLAAVGYPLLGAASRKSFVGRAMMPSDAQTPPAPEDRVAGSIACSLMQFASGVRLFRVHDVGPHAEALRTASRIANAAPE